MNLLLAQLLGKPSLTPPWCVVCGRPATNSHHVIPGDRKNPLVPLLRLCGSGTTGHHGKAHEKRLHFRYTEGWEYLVTEDPTRYETALELDGWKRLP